GDAGRLLFTQNGGLWTLSLSDGQSSQLVSRPEIGQVLNARWSPDGTRIAYGLYEVRNRSEPMSQVFLTGMEGGPGERVLGADQPRTYYQAPVWGPNGAHLYAQYSSLEPDL